MLPARAESTLLAPSRCPRRAESKGCTSAVGVLWDFSGTSGFINRHEHETTERRFAQVSDKILLIAAGRRTPWSLPGHLTSGTQRVCAQRHLPRHPSMLPARRFTGKSTPRGRSRTSSRPSPRQRTATIRAPGGPYVQGDRDLVRQPLRRHRVRAQREPTAVRFVLADEDLAAVQIRGERLQPADLHRGQGQRATGCRAEGSAASRTSRRASTRCVRSCERSAAIRPRTRRCARTARWRGLPWSAVGGPAAQAATSDRV